jgi:hypothetical protein
MNAISALLERAKTLAAAPLLTTAPPLSLTRRVRSRDSSSAPGFVVAEEGDWVVWFGDDGLDHISRVEFLETIE